ncbi:hypothetical protein GUJ93_ZPchr0010g7710 [Zizania palustris]|uniref:Zinc finger GRF-type domain-containing protein n=1 Tax=Zizania palustris TaxID=103762 RepID=A0A8J5WHQ8_ZIZPA|nr:hypothetical protein GUJ93_ZPchr0010g7710 [Zizania palustris]
MATPKASAEMRRRSHQPPPPASRARGPPSPLPSIDASRHGCAESLHSRRVAVLVGRLLLPWPRKGLHCHFRQPPPHAMARPRASAIVPPADPSAPPLPRPRSPSRPPLKPCLPSKSSAPAPSPKPLMPASDAPLALKDPRSGGGGPWHGGEVGGGGGASCGGMRAGGGRKKIRLGPSNSAGSKSSNEDYLGENLPLIDCPQCRIPVVKLWSKRMDTFNRVFYKCTNNFQNDDNCAYFWWQFDYVNLLRVKQHKQRFVSAEQDVELTEFVSMY